MYEAQNLQAKTRLGKLNPGAPVENLPDAAASCGLDLLPILPAHAIASMQPEPHTRDPFDRLLLAQCRREGMRLITLDRALIAHPLAAR